MYLVCAPGDFWLHPLLLLQPLLYSAPTRSQPTRFGPATPVFIDNTTGLFADGRIADLVIHLRLGRHLTLYWQESVPRFRDDSPSPLAGTPSSSLNKMAASSMAVPLRPSNIASGRPPLSSPRLQNLSLLSFVSRATDEPVTELISDWHRSLLLLQDNRRISSLWSTSLQQELKFENRNSSFVKRSWLNI